jgi:tetratricopeptide (TPR) repeat protein
MTPYRFSLLRPLKYMFFLLIVVIAYAVTPVTADSPEKVRFDTLTRSGYTHYYNLEYDQAIRDFQEALEASPDEPKAINHLAEARLFQQLYRFNALDTRLYLKQRFINGKQVPIEPATKKQLLAMVDQARAASDKRLKSNPKDAQALYSRGVAEGIRATYLTIVEHSFLAALRSALAARRDHEEVLKLMPNFSDAKTIPGAHKYVVGSLSFPAKILAGIAGIRGDKNKGLEMLSEAGKGGGESSIDARVTLALFLRREGRYQEAIDLIATLLREHPHNFLFALEEGNLLRDAGRGPESIANYRATLNDCKEGRYPAAHVESLQFALGEALRGQVRLTEALEAYRAAADGSGYDPDLHQRSLLAAAQVSDLLAQRQDALNEYRAAIALDSSSDEAQTARKYLDRPYRGH